MFAAEVALGDIMVFIDSHCECLPGWLQPLISEIFKDKHVIASPVVDVIQPNSLVFSYTSVKKGMSF
jgi:polypeptide N-acetylgalactosaminyltransferase